ncbi:hypothetical protein [Cellulomonas phragmiteti]|uniref:HEAT repeat domain-containing protein n=1 Tax=Cellulomonas phragmiteti TaxID=478780 RepID=A0ABQ4DGL5_9CELL|nr:hypothetical protein [Cellulomonas phragmiteti]GIG38484.1 hypothetical protein Cph01nite_02460 [Cellulomonas phragmiteti]
MTEPSCADLADRFDAYGPATATPGHLRALTGADLEARGRAVRHLWSAVLHQGTPATVTPGAVRYLLAVLPDLWVDRATALEVLALLELVAREGTVPHEPRSALEASVAAHPDAEDVLRALTAAGREDDFYDSPELTGALLARAALGCRDVQADVVMALDALPAVADEREEAVRRARAAAARVVGASRGDG